MKLLELFLLLALSTLVSGHGKLVVPLSRFGTGYENDPVGFPDTKSGNKIADYICRHESKQHSVADPDWTAGQDVTVQWAFSAPHVGDCEGYISYDVDKPREQMGWVKIANWPECNHDNHEDVRMALPDWLPEGKAVFRFHWYALHNSQADSIEFYTQCSDINIHSATKEWPTGLLPFTLINPPLFPSVGAGYRNPFHNPPEKWMTGPSCSAPTGYNMDNVNNCHLTTPANVKGWLDVSEGSDPDIVPPDNDDDNNDDNNDDNGNDDNGNDDDNHNHNDPKICPSEIWVTISPVATNLWCQQTCSWNIDYCDAEVCACQGGYEDFDLVDTDTTAPSVGITATWRVIYINWRVSNWFNLYTDIKKAVDSGFNVVILAFHMGVDSSENEIIMDAAQVWRDMTAQERQQTKDYMATKNARLLVSMGGETMSFESEIQKQSAQGLCTRVGQWALDHNLDGVDVDMELEPGNSAPFHDGTAIDWLVTCTKALRTKLGSEGLISHAPLAPYFGTWAGPKRGYVEVYKQAPTINILNIQYYNQGSWAYTTYQDLFVHSTLFPGTAVLELLDADIPEDKIVVGKPVYDGDASNGHVSPSDLRSWASQACNDMNWSAGFMGWQYRPGFSTTLFATQLSSTICHNVAQTPMLGSSLTVPLYLPSEQPQGNVSDGAASGWWIVLGIVGGFIVLAAAVFFYWRSQMQTQALKTNLVNGSSYDNMNNV